MEQEDIEGKLTAIVETLAEDSTLLIIHVNRNADVTALLAGDAPDGVVRATLATCIRATFNESADDGMERLGSLALDAVKLSLEYGDETSARLLLDLQKSASKGLQKLLYEDCYISGREMRRVSDPDAN
jgi:hypothetical protein